MATESNSFYKSKLVDWLRSLSPGELHELQDCLRLSFLCIGKQSTRLLLYILQTDPHLDNGRMSREAVFSFLFPEQEKYQAQAQNKAMADLLLSLEQYLAIKALKKDKLIQSKLLIRALSDRSLYSQMEKKWKQWDGHLEKRTDKSASHYLEKMQMDAQVYYHPDHDKFSKEASQKILSANSNLEKFYSLSKLQYSCELLARQKAIDEQHAIPLREELLSFAEQQSEPAFPIYLQLNRMLQGPDERETFRKLYRLFLQDRQVLSQREQANVLQMMINQVNQWYKHGEKSYLEILLELYLLGLEGKLLLAHQRITDVNYTNVIIVAALLKKFNLAEQLEEKYQHYLEPGIKANAVALGRAFRLFHQQRFDEAHQELTRVDFTDIGYKLRARSLLIRCYYESFFLGDTVTASLIYSFASQFRKFIYRNPMIPPETRESYKLLISVVRQLTKADLYKPQKKILTAQKLRALVKEQPVIAEEWVLKKIEDLVE